MLTIILEDEVFAGSDLGNVNLSEQYLLATGRTDRTAVRNFVTAFEAAGFLSKFGVARLFGGGSSLSDSINLINPVANASANQAAFQNDNASYHTTTGWKPNATALHYARGNFFISGDLTHFHIHAYNTTPEEQGSTVNRFLAGFAANATGNNIQISLQRNGQNFMRGSVGAFTGASVLQGPSGQTSGVGLLSAARVGNVAKLYDNGTAIVTNSNVTNTPATNGTSNMFEGSNSNAAAQVTSATLLFMGYGFADWTDADETALKTMLDTFKAAIGA